MKPHQCENESRVIEAVRTGRWDAALQQHVGQCEFCADAALAARVLNDMRAVDEAEARIPDAGLMWWKAQLLAKQRAAERATQPINFIERFAYVWAVVCAVGVCIWHEHAIRAWLASLASGPLSLKLGSSWSFTSRAWSNAILNLPSKSAYVQGPGLAVMVSIAILLIFVVFAAYFTHSEE
jgi:hypothetical protein